MTVTDDRAAERAHLPSDYRWGIVIPTIGTPEVLIPTLRRLVARLPDSESEGRVVISICVNPTEANVARWEELEAELKQIALRVYNANHAIDWENTGRPIGFGHANNRGLQAMLEFCGLPDLTVFFNDDLRVTPGWLQGMSRALQAEHVRLVGEPPSQPTEHDKFQLTRGGQVIKVGQRPDRRRSEYGRIGIIGPCSVNVAGVQCVKLADKKAEITEANADSFAEMFRRDNAGEYVTASFLSGFCMGITAECLLDLAYRDSDGDIIGVFNGDQYPIAGYEDNDLCVRADLAGWRLLVDGETFIYHLGHASFDAFFPEMQRGMRNRLNYYEEWRGYTQRLNQRVIAIYRCRIETGNDIGLLRASIVGMARLVDGFAVLLTDNPMEACRSQDWQQTVPTLSQADREWLNGCIDPQTKGPASPKKIARSTRLWIEGLVSMAREKHRGRPCAVKVRCWESEFNERDERNYSIEMAESMGADWLWSVDHDELPEDRVLREHVDRWLTHPDPMVHSWDVAWLNHWDSPRMCRADRPWGDGMAYTGGMHGARLWRANRAAPRRIQAGTEIGLHCGNCPDVGVEAKRVAAFRFRHMGYLRAFDRRRKLKRYQDSDPNPDPWLVGNQGYGHLVEEEGARFYPYVAVNGVGLHVLVYENEDPDDVGRLLDQLYGVVDSVVLVWTGEWEEGARLAVEASPQDVWDDGIVWPESGPSRELMKYADLFDADVIHHPLADNIAEARNAGLAHLRREVPAVGLGWGLFLDPDEHLQSPMTDCYSIRRMAEVSNGWGWMFRFYNILRGREAPSLSESIRMSRLDSGGVMMMNGRVHEGFDHAMESIRSAGDHPTLRYAPFKMLNAGQSLTDEQMEAKLQRYAEMLVLELEESPLSAKAWTSLGIHAENQGDLDTAVECWRRGMLCPGNSYLPWKEMALYHLRMAKMLTSEVLERTSQAHGYYQVAGEHLMWLREHAPERPLLGSARKDPANRRGLGFDLPPFGQVLDVSTDPSAGVVDSDHDQDPPGQREGDDPGVEPAREG